MSVTGITILLLALLFSAGLYYHRLLGKLIYYQYWRWQNTLPFRQGYLSHDEATLYYRVYGRGEPLLLLHGGLTSMKVFFTILPALAARYQVVLLDFRGQGRSSFGSRVFSYHLLADDVLAVLNFLGIAKTAVIGWSDGGNAGLLLALEHAARVSSLMAIGANFHPEGLSETTRAELKSTNLFSDSLFSKAMYYLDSPHPSRWKELRTRLTCLWLTHPDIAIAELADISTPTLVIVGERDNVTLEHARVMAQSLQHARLEVIPGAGHNLLLEVPEVLLQQFIMFQSEITVAAFNHNLH